MVPAIDKKLTLTTVIPTYNRSGLLLRAVNSIRQQTYPHWKLIVCDNASTDGTREIMTELVNSDQRIHYFRHPENVGMLSNWEFALSQIDTPYFSLLCDDDYLLPEFFDAAVKEIESHPELGLCFGATYVVDEEGNKISIAPKPMTPGYYPAGQGAVAMLIQQHPATPAILFQTECFKAVGGFDRKSLYVADLDMILRVALSYPVKYFDKETACYVVHAENSFKDVSGWHPGLLNLVKNLKAIDGQHGVYVQELFFSLSKHAVVPLFTQFFRYPGRFNIEVIISACNCMLEMQQVSNTLYGIIIAVVRFIGAVIKKTLFDSEKHNKNLLSRISGSILKLSRSFYYILFPFKPQISDMVVLSSRHNSGSRLILFFRVIGVLAFLIVFGLIEFFLVRPCMYIRAVLSRFFFAKSISG